MKGRIPETAWGMLLGALVGWGLGYLARSWFPEYPYDLQSSFLPWSVLVAAFAGGALQLYGFGRATIHWRRRVVAWLVGGMLLSSVGFWQAQRAVVQVSYDASLQVLWLIGLGERLPSCGCKGTDDARCINRLATPDEVIACWGRAPIQLAAGLLTGTFLLTCACISAAVGVLLLKGLERGRVLEANVEQGGPALEKVLQRQNPFLDPVDLRQRLATLERQICLIELSGEALGTGFLIGRNLVLTNYHVVECVIRRPVLSSELRCVFDFRNERGRAVREGRSCSLAADWNVDASPPSFVDSQRDPKPDDPTMDELDHAVLKLAEDVGGDDSDGVQRGWMTLPDSFPLVERDPLVILQHPRGRPLRLAIDSEAILGLNVSKNRVRYRTNTEPGSSGSPCFDLRLQTLVAVHHSGSPATFRTAYNEGIPADCIRRRLVARKVLLEEGSSTPAAS